MRLISFWWKWDEEDIGDEEVMLITFGQKVSGNDVRVYVNTFIVSQGPQIWWRRAAKPQIKCLLCVPHPTPSKFKHSFFVSCTKPTKSNLKIYTLQQGLRVIPNQFDKLHTFEVPWLQLSQQPKKKNKGEIFVEKSSIIVLLQ